MSTPTSWNKRLSELENKIKELSDVINDIISSNGLKATKYEWGRRDLNSGHRLPKAKFSNDNVEFLDYDSVKRDFTNWIYSRVESKTAKDYLSYLDRYLAGVRIKNTDDLIEVSLMVQAGWNHFAKAVRNLINYHLDKRLISKEFALELKEILKLKKSGFDTFVPNDEIVKQVLNDCEREDYKLVMKIVYYSGVRIVEALKILREFDPKKLHIIDEIAYYDLDWERGNKKAFKCFLPSDLAKSLSKMDIPEYGVKSYFTSRGLPLKYGRNWFVNKLVQLGVNEGVIQFMIGH
jgi:intergrase/recombinase